MRMAGMTGEAKDIVIKPGEFEASSLEFSRADNPSLPNFDPTNPNLVFRLESLKYKDGHFAVGGVVGIKDWQLGNAIPAMGARWLVIIRGGSPHWRA